MSTLVQRLTPGGAGGVAVVGVRGPEACSRVRRLVPHLPAVGELRLAQLRFGDELLDEGLLVRRADDHFELGLHGGPGLVTEVIAALGGPSAPSTGSVEELAAAALVDAPCDRAARVLLDQVRGALREAVLAGDEPAGGWQGVWSRYRRLLEPATVVLAGPVNAGKSSLFNLLVGQARVSVSSEEGTTRDAISARVQVGHHVVDLVDTAGERHLEVAGPDTAVGVERRSQALGRALRDRADLVLWLSPEEGDAPTGERVRALVSRADDGPPHQLSVLARPVRAVELVHGVLREALGLDGDPWSPGAPVPPSQAVAAGLDGALALPLGSDRDRALRAALGPGRALPLP